MLAMDDNTEEWQGRHDDDGGDVVVVVDASTANNENTNATSEIVVSSTPHLSPEEAAVDWRDKGNAFYSAKKLSEAAKAYDAGLKALEEGGSPTSSSPLAIILRSNQALVLLKMREFKLAEQESSKVLEVDPDNVKALLRRASAREGQFYEVAGDSRTTEILVPAIDDLQNALGILDRERHEQNSEAKPSTPSNNATGRSVNRNLTQECQRLLDRLEKEFDRTANKKEKGRPTSAATTTSAATHQTNSTDKPPPQRREQQPKPENRRRRANGFHHTSNTTQQSSPSYKVNTHATTTVTPSAAQQKKDVMKLLLARQQMLQQSSKNSINNKKAGPSLQGEAFFLLEWNWWVRWCRYVDFFYLRMRKQETSNGGAPINSNNNYNQDRLQRVLQFLPPGAIVPVKPRVDPKDETEDESSTDDDDDSDEVDFAEEPGPIDNSILLVKPSDRFYHQWYRQSIENSNNHNHTALKPNLIRGYHYELVPREVYNALRSWYGEVTPRLCRRTTDRHDVVLYPLPPGSSAKTTPLMGMIPRNQLPRCSACRAPGAIRRCKHCLSVQYCDRACQESHWPFHKAFCREIAEMASKNYDDNDRIKAAAGAHEFLPPDSNGRVGLNQLGNTCFMNAALQSLSHATPLTRFFLSGRFRADLNSDNPLGTGGKLAMAFETTIKDLWMKPGIRSTSPSDLKRAIAQFAPRFAGCLQHDSQEFLAYLLDGLHEDLNRIREAPYVEMPDVTNGHNMAVAAAEAWDAHKRRNDSLVMDTFYGQFQSTCICPQCNRVSVSFDAFNHVSLEIPQPAQSAPIAIPVLVHFADGTKKPVQYGITIQRQARIRELKNCVAELSLVPATDLVLTGVYENHIYTLLDERKCVSAIDVDQDTIVAYEVIPCETQGTIHAVVTHSFFVQGNNVADNDKTMERDDAETNEYKAKEESQERRLVGLPFLTALSKDSTCHDLYNTIWKLVRRMIVGSTAGIVPCENATEEFIDSYERYRAEDVLTLRVVDSKGVPQATFETAEEGGKTSVLPKHADTTLSECLGEDCTESFLFLMLEWKNPKDAETAVIHLERFLDFEVHPSLAEAVRQQQQRTQYGQKGVTLDQCFQSFSKPERLDEHNMWYCSKCKEHVRALKTMKLWRLPNVLVIHLKRFEFRHGFRRDKLDTYVHFPLGNLNMDPHTAHWKSASEGDRPFVDSTVPADYDLFAVVNHYGRMGFGHYTAFAMQWDETGVSKEWNLFDDSSVRPVDPSDVRTSAAYILFYRRRKFN